MPEAALRVQKQFWKPLDRAVRRVRRPRTVELWQPPFRRPFRLRAEQRGTGLGGVRSPLGGVRSPFGDGRRSQAQRFAKGKREVISWCFDDPTSDMGSVYINSDASPSLNFKSSLSSEILAKFTGWSATSPMIVRGGDGTLKHAPHNLTLRSQNFTNAYWNSVACTITDNNITAPDGTLTAARFIPTAVSHDHGVYDTVGAVSPGRIAVYAKHYAGSYRLALHSAGGSTPNVVFDLEAGTVASDPNSSNPAIVPVGNGWYLCSMDAAGSTFTKIYVANAANAVVYVADGTSGIYVWGAHSYRTPVHSARYIEDGLATTSTPKFHIPTTYDTSGNKLGFLSWEARTNAAWWSRDLTQSAHVKTNATAYLTAKGTDGIAASASRLVATAANGNVIQQITAASAQRVTSAKVRRARGSGTVKMSQGETTGSELVTNGAFGTDTSGWSAGYDTASSTFTAAAGQATLAKLGADVYPRFKTTLSGLTVGKLYAISLTTISEAGNGDKGVVFTSVSDGTGGQVFGQSANPSGSATYYAIATATTMYLTLFMAGGVSGTDTWTVDNVSVKECTSTTLSLTSPTYKEVTGTELVTSTSTPVGGWTESGGIITAPGTSGGTDRVLFALSSSVTAGKLYKVAIPNTMPANSFYVDFDAAGGGQVGGLSSADNVVYIVPSGSSSSIRIGRWVGAPTGTIGPISVKEVSPTQAWTEVETAAATITNPCVAIWSDTANDVLDIDHVQCEVGAKASPPIITAGAAVTRALSILKVLSGTFPASVSDFYAVAEAIPGESNAAAGILCFDANGRMIELPNLVPRIFDGTNLVASSFTATVGQRFKAASTGSGATARISANGGTSVSGTYDGTINSGDLYVGSRNVASPINGIVRRVLYAPIVGTAADIEADSVLT